MEAALGAYSADSQWCHDPGPGRQPIVTEDAAVIENLELLRREWGHAYLIWYQLGLYCARRRGNAATCRRTRAEDLRAEIATDYRAYPVLV
jgi:hypothetical protein